MSKQQFLLTLSLFASAWSVQAQIAKWLIQPDYDTIRMATIPDVVITEQADQTILWTTSGTKLCETNDVLYDFCNNRAISLIGGTDKVSRIYRPDGTCFDTPQYSVAHQYPYYSCGMFLVTDGSFYRFINDEGATLAGMIIEAKPFFNGYATCTSYANFDKRKDPYNYLLDTEGNSVVLSFRGKEFSNKDLDFASSLNDDSLAVVVLKDKLYFFHGSNQELTPIFGTAEETNLKNQAKLPIDLGMCYSTLPDSTSVLNARYGKNGNMSFYFDRFRRLTRIKSADSISYQPRTVPAVVYESPMELKQEEALYGLQWDEQEILPSQFDEISLLFDTKAFVKLNGKYGMLDVDREANFAVKINKGNDISFIHQKVETSVRIDMPTFLSSKKVFIELPEECGCQLDKTSRSIADTEGGNFVTYDCEMFIPDSLADDGTTSICYPINVTYNGLKAPTLYHDVNVWYFKNFEVDEDESQRSLDNGDLTMIFTYRKIQDDGIIYPTGLRVVSDSLHCEIVDSFSAVRYKIKAYDLKEGINSIVVQVIEQGCPPVSFPYEIEYHKPEEKSKNKPAKKESVTVVRKAKSIIPV